MKKIFFRRYFRDWSVSTLIYFLVLMGQLEAAFWCRARYSIPDYNPWLTHLLTNHFSVIAAIVAAAALVMGFLTPFFTSILKDFFLLGYEFEE